MSLGTKRRGMKTSVVALILMASVGTLNAVTVSCKPTISFASANGVCDGLKKIDDVLSKINNGMATGYSDGGCNISVTGGLSCLTGGGLQAACNSAASRMITPLSSAINQRKSFTLTSGMGIPSQNCSEKALEITKFKSGLTMEEIYNKTGIKKMSKKFGLFSSSTDTVRDCMKQKSGNDCLEKGIKLPETSLAAKTEIMKTAGVVASADASVAANAKSIQAQYTKKRIDCEKKSQYKGNKCMDELVGVDEAESLERKQIAAIETSSAVEISLMMKAIRGDKYFVFKDPKSMRKISQSIAPRYRSGVARQNAADILIKTLYKDLLQIKKTIVSETYQTAQAQSIHYDSKSAIDDLVNSIHLEDED